MKKIIILVLIAFYASSIFAQILTFNQGKIKQKNYLQKIPYQER
jgi:Na+-translocating ferredoxin:NAD+ oxidoreductase RnfG subunit